MRIFVYEHVTAIGLGREPGSAEHSLYVEGRAMRDAVAADFAAVPGVEVLTGDAFRELAAQADWTFLIAPETGGELERLAREVLAAGGRLLGPSPDAIRLTADKLELCRHWQQHGVPTPGTRECAYHTPPFVLKPRDGAGSDSTFLIRAEAEYHAALRTCTGPMIAQPLVPGTPASVAFLCGPTGAVPLLSTFQILSTDGRFRYEGGCLPIPPDLAERAVAIGRQAVACVPGLLAYVGVDLILGEADVAIEINPRLTTSYVGLRKMCEQNLAEALLAAVESREFPLTWRSGRVRFFPDGSTEYETKAG